jgi:hypothetical protein
MALAVQPIRPGAHVPGVRGVLRRLEVAPGIDRLLPPHPAHVLASGRGVAALGRAILDGEHARSTGGRRWAERGRMALLQPGFTRAARHDDRCGPSRDALCAAHLHRVCGASALTALAV